MKQFSFLWWVRWTIYGLINEPRRTLSVPAMWIEAVIFRVRYFITSTRQEIAFAKIQGRALGRALAITYARQQARELERLDRLRNPDKWRGK